TFNVQSVPGTTVLQAVACSSATACVAVGQFNDATGSHGVVVPITNGVPGAPQVVTGTGILSGVACSDATHCVAVGAVTDANRVSRAVVVPIVNGVAGTAQKLPDTEGLTAVACYSATSCVAVGTSSFQGVVVPITNGVGGVAQFVQNDDGGLTGVACYGPTACVAVGNNFPLFESDGVVVLISDGTAGAAQLVTTTTTLIAVACRVSVCEATGALQSTSQPGVVQIVDGVPGTPQAAPGSINNLLGIACPTDTACEAVGSGPGTGVLVPVNSGVPGDPVSVPGTAALNGVACATTFTCLAVGNNTDQSAGVVVTIAMQATPTIVTSASASVPAGGSISDTANLSGGAAPTGTITFTAFGPHNPTCSGDAIFTATKAVAGNGTYTSGPFATPTPGTYNFIASYSGDANNSPASTSCGDTNEKVTVTCTTTITGNRTGAIILRPGSTCLSGAHITGSIIVAAGATLDVENSTITGSITAVKPSTFRLCGSTIRGAVSVTGATGFVLIGDPGDDGCATNSIGGSLTLLNNTHGLEVIGNHVAGVLVVSGNSGKGPYPEDTAPEISGNFR
ncbi:MAG: Ig-like domain-containing protein, partial [Actinomycetota bacterium]|nr:Ig-like domain-containing protein [Actinomycetota bacterium]